VLGGREIPLSARELALLAAFIRHNGQVLSRSQLLDMVWDLNFDPGSNVVEVYVAALRRKLGPEWIDTVRGLGYRFSAPTEAAAEPVP
jgi:DNA-binding response OmpR family regulator